MSRCKHQSPKDGDLGATDRAFEPGQADRFPLVIVGTAFAIGMDTTQGLVAVIFGGVPTAAASFSLARAMGGDVAAMAAIATIGTVVTFLTLPLTLMLAEVALCG